MPETPKSQPDNYNETESKLVIVPYFPEESSFESKSIPTNAKINRISCRKGDEILGLEKVK